MSSKIPTILKQFKNYSRSPLEPAAYSGVLAGMNQDQLQAIRAWLASPQLESADVELLELLKTVPKPLKIAWTASEPRSPHRLSSASP